MNGTSSRRASVPAASADLYYDPYDTAIDDDPYPVWKRMRDEAPLYHNETYGFHALSRWDDVARALVDWETYRSGRGTVLDLIRANVPIPPGIILFEDPPLHDLHRSLLTRVFTPRRMNALEPLVRQFCARALDPLVGAGEFDVIAELGATVPMRTIGYLLGIPEQDQEAIRTKTDERLALKDGKPTEFDVKSFDDTGQLFADYIDWRAKHPSDDLMTELLNAELEEDGERRRLTRSEVLLYTNTIAGAGNETVTRLIGFTAQLLADHPAQRRALCADPSLIPGAIEEVLRYEAPSPVQCRHVAADVELHGETVRKDAIMLLLNGSANRDDRHFPDADRFDVRRDDGPHQSFGHGLHFCLGASLARLQGRIVLDELLKRWPTWEVDYDRAHKAHTASVRGWAKLPIRTGSKGATAR
jgi:cytochrome P450